MTDNNLIPSLNCGIAVIHSNRLEELRDVVEYWLRLYPLMSLENEIFLVQSNGMGQWLKQSLAANHSLGVAAATSTQLPSLFIWNVYRTVLGDQIPKQQLLSKAPLTWRLFRLLPNLSRQPGFETLAKFLSDDDNHRKRYQLSEQLADLFDQYQVYRSDWISDWAKGLDKLRHASGLLQALPEQHQWQATLWRAILTDLGDTDTAYASRASVHALFMSRIDGLEQRPAALPRRIILFGLSSLPQQSLEVLAKLGKFCQIILFVQNPCRYYWADIIEDKELLKSERRRQKNKPGIMATMSVEDLHTQVNPLLAAWGKQGRDYLRLLDQFDEIAQYENWHWPDNKIDLFKDYGEPGERSLLQQLQQSILDLEPTPTTPIILPKIDSSLAFHIAHSPLREVEILHDQLLDRFNKAESTGNRLFPRDIIVMVPDINNYAPHIRAVFGQFKPDDARYIPYSLGDQQQRGQDPFLMAVEALTNLPDWRFNVSDVLGLLEVPALRNRFGIEESIIPQLQQWIEESGIRWGLDAKQRTQAVTDIPDNLESNTWQFGLQRMLLGYAVGSGAAFNGIEPYEEIAGLESLALGKLSYFIEILEKYSHLLQGNKNYHEWQQLLQTLLDDFFVISDEQEQKTWTVLTNSLTSWVSHCELAKLTETDTLPLNVIRDAWLSHVDEPTLHQRFLSGRVNFCTLMPMRAIPFRVICILGMNDGDYPRLHLPLSFDLMSQRGQYRPGDRSRRQDDQYLFLEALLSAREQLYISWVGRNIRDNSELPPSVLISQLREVLESGWRLADGSQSLLAHLTLEHPLQPFSKQYVAPDRDSRLFTYAKEWFEELSDINIKDSTAVKANGQNLNLSLETLANFLRSPVKAFCNHTLKFGFDVETSSIEDDEPFTINPLKSYGLIDEILNNARRETPADLDIFFDRQLTSKCAKGELPLGSFAKSAFEQVKLPVTQAWQQYQAILQDWPLEQEPLAIELTFKLAKDVTIQLTGSLTQIRQKEGGLSAAAIHSTAQSLTKDNKVHAHKLIPNWVQHLAGCAYANNFQTLVVSPDTVITFPTLPNDKAYDLLNNLIDAWYQGMQEPLPVACKTAFAWLAAKPDNADNTAKLEYEGTDWNPGEVNYDAYLARFFPRFSNLRDTDSPDNFHYWAEALYRPLFDALN